jgi:ABC-type multidrug transport system, ATPase component
MLFDRLTFGYRRGRAVLKDFTWEVPPGRTVLLGPNGAGKSTLLAIGADAEQPWSGTVLIDGLTPRRFHPARGRYRRLVGWMPQHIRVVPGMTGREQVAYAGWLKGLSRREAWDAAGTAMAMVGLSHLEDQRASTYSGGQQRRLGLAQAIVHRPRVLLLDEPTVGLDPAQRQRFRAIMQAASDQPGLRVIASTHQVDDLSDLYDTVAVLHAGTLRFAGSTADFLATGSGKDQARAVEAAYARLIGDDLS